MNNYFYKNNTTDCLIVSDKILQKKLLKSFRKFHLEYKITAILAEKDTFPKTFTKKVLQTIKSIR